MEPNDDMLEEVRHSGGPVDLARQAFEWGVLSTGAFGVAPTAEEARRLYALVPPGHEIHEFEVDHLLPNPRRKTGHRAFTRAASFVAYVNAHKTTATAIYCDETRWSAILNDHEPNELDGEPPDSDDGNAGWGDHVATFELTPTPAWAAWLRENESPMAQAEFAEFLEDRLPEIVEPDGATLLELAQDLRYHTEARFESRVNTTSGRVALRYEEEETAVGSSKRELAFPTHITVEVEPFEGVAARRLRGRFRYRIAGGKATFGYAFGEDVRRVVREVQDLVGDQIAGETGIRPYFGR